LRHPRLRRRGKENAKGGEQRQRANEFRHGNSGRRKPDRGRRGRARKVNPRTIGDDRLKDTGRGTSVRTGKMIGPVPTATRGFSLSPPGACAKMRREKMSLQ